MSGKQEAMRKGYGESAHVGPWRSYLTLTLTVEREATSLEDSEQRNELM